MESPEKPQEEILDQVKRMLEEFKASHNGRAWNVNEMKDAFGGQMPNNPLVESDSIASEIFFCSSTYEGPIGKHSGWIFFTDTGGLTPNRSAESEPEEPEKVKKT